jgi:uroporphyrinogen decarboxylase
VKKETMTSRERVLAAINHRPVDRVPIDMGSHMSTGISMFAYWELREKLGLSTDNIWIPDMVQGLAFVDEDVMERFHIDVMLLEPPYDHLKNWNPRGKYNFKIPALCYPEKNQAGEWFVNQSDQTMRMPAGGYFFDGAWLSDWSDKTDEEKLKLYAREAERIYKETDYAMNFLGYSHGFGIGGFGAANIDKAMMAYDNPKELHEIQKKIQESMIKRLGQIFDAFGEFIQIISLNDDIGSQTGPLCSPDFIQEYCMDYYRPVNEFIHRNSDIKSFLHSCGSVRQLMPAIVEAGFDIINPVQISADHMDPQELKNEFGEDLCFWGGGCNTQHVLNSKSPEDVTANVKELMSIFKRNGGFIFNQVHNIMGDVPPENIIAMLDTAYEESFSTP